MNIHGFQAVAMEKEVFSDVRIILEKMDKLAHVESGVSLQEHRVAAHER